MKSVRELMKENRKGTFVPVNNNSSGLTADMEESFIEEVLNDEIEKKVNTSGLQNTTN